MCVYIYKYFYYSTFNNYLNNETLSIRFYFESYLFNIVSDFWNLTVRSTYTVCPLIYL